MSRVRSTKKQLKAFRAALADCPEANLTTVIIGCPFGYVSKITKNGYHFAIFSGLLRGSSGVGSTMRAAMLGALDTGLSKKPVSPSRGSAET